MLPSMGSSVYTWTTKEYCNYPSDCGLSLLHLCVGVRNKSSRFNVIQKKRSSNKKAMTCLQKTAAARMERVAPALLQRACDVILRSKEVVSRAVSAEPRRGPVPLPPRFKSDKKASTRSVRSDSLSPPGIVAIHTLIV